MINNWMIPRNKRKLTSLVDSLAAFSILAVGGEWFGDVEKQREFEALLERQRLKRPGDRRDMRAGGARTYEAQLSSLGLIFSQDSSSRAMRLTLAGEAMINGDPPIPLLRKQLLTFQYPSEYSLRQNVRISPKYKIRPFLFILRLLADEEIGTLSEQEVARFVITYAYTDSDYDKVKKMILKYRQLGNDEGWIEDAAQFLKDTGGSRTHGHSLEQRLTYLEEIANTFFNYMESAQLVERIRDESSIRLNPDFVLEHQSYLTPSLSLPLMKDAEKHEVFQRRYGLDLVKTKDTRSFGAGQITNQELQYRLVMREYLDIASKTPLLEVTGILVNKIADTTGVPQNIVKNILLQKIPRALDTFEAGYWDMAHQGTEQATDFEISTMMIFRDILNYYAEHIGQDRSQGRRGGNPDVFVVSFSDEYSGIIDTKAYSAYGLDNDHRNRMKSDYIPAFYRKNLNGKSIELAFYMYVAGGFDKGFNTKLNSLSSEVSLRGSAITASNMIRLLRRHTETPFHHKDLLKLFTLNRELAPSDFGA
ncbi:MAG: hypothetical protein C4584_00985 [Armatimonadetes bacterium]|nr:MAG: hypothetical protein C4584_00985 [Armatimonadota bacterium]